MKIRLLESNDWQAFKALRLEALSLHPEAFGSSFEEESKLTDEAFQHGYNNCNIFGAFVDDELIGCAGFYINASKKCLTVVVYFRCIQKILIEIVVQRISYSKQSMSMQNNVSFNSI
jgi:hypothetical protein